MKPNSAVSLSDAELWAWVDRQPTHPSHLSHEPDPHEGEPVKILGQEPAAIAGLIGTIVALVVAFGVQLSATQTGAIMAVTSAFLGVVVRSQVTPVGAGPAPAFDKVAAGGDAPQSDAQSPAVAPPAVPALVAGAASADPPVPPAASNEVLPPPVGTPAPQGGPSDGQPPVVPPTQGA